MSENKYLGKEKISKLLLKFSIPCVMGLLISALYNIIDQIFVGHAMGVPGMSATTVSFPIICIANAFAWCIGDGAASYLSICSGRKDTESTHKCIGTGIVVTFIISILLTLVGEIFAPTILPLFGADAESYDYALQYFGIIAAFFPFYLSFNVMNSMIRADGSPRYAMCAMLLGAILNIGLDYLFINIFKWEIAGAAWATVIGQMASFIMCSVYFFKPKTFKLKLKSFFIDIHILRNIVALGGATFVTQISIAAVTLVSNMVLKHYGSLSDYGSTRTIAAFGVQTKVYTIVCNIVTGIVLGGQPIFGYNYGARRYDRVKKAYKIVLILTLLIGGLSTLFIQLCPNFLINLFGKGDELYVEFTTKVFRIYLSFMTITCLIKMTAVFFQSIGKSLNAFVSSLVRDILLFIPVVLGLSFVLELRNPGKGINGLLFAAPIADFISIFVILVLTISFFKKLSKLDTEEISEEVIINESRPGIVLTISREHGSRGKQIGKMVAEKLGIPFYYKEIIALAAKESGLDKEFISNLNSDAPNVLYDLYLSSDAVKQSIIAQEKIVRRIANSGSCVIVGRASDYILRDYANVINIFIYAPKDFRIKNIMEMYADNEEKAIENVKKSDHTRASYYRNVTGKKWGDPHNYKVCLDSSLGIDLCVDHICEIYNLATKKLLEE